VNAIECETELAAILTRMYRRPQFDIITDGFRPLSGMPADFCTVAHAGRHHFFYIERRLTEATPFFPGNEIYFGHASTADLFAWEVHDPVLLIRPGTWEGAHVWAPFVLRHQERFVMAYTGVNDHLAQNLGLAVSHDLFCWERLPSNPISPCRDRPWAAWREDGIASCRDPHLLVQAGRVWMTYTATTRAGAACIALCSTPDLSAWDDHGPLLIGPADGYAVNPWGGHPQGKLESSCLVQRAGRWRLLVQFTHRASGIRNWIFESDRMDRFAFEQGREFWPGAYTVEIVKERGLEALLACSGPIRFGAVDWSAEWPVGRFLTRAELERWRD